MLDEVFSSITKRDIEICLDVYHHRFLTVHQAHRLHFNSYSRARNRLLRLSELRVLDRFRPSRPTGSHPYYYVLGEVGIQIVCEQLGVEPKELRYDIRKAKRQAFSPQLRHSTEVNDFFATLAYGGRMGGKWQLTEWLSEQGCTSRWKDYVTPDGCGRLDSGEGAASFFLELDRGTEVLSRLADKLDQYGAVAAMDDAPDAILFCFPTSNRELSARRVLFDCGMAVATGVLETHLDQPLGANWLSVGANRRVELTELGAQGARRRAA